MPRRSYVEFPGWEKLVRLLVDAMHAARVVPHTTAQIELDQIIERLKVLRSICQDYSPSRIHELLSAAQARYIPRDSFEKVLDRMKEIPLGPNEFYTVFNMRQNEFTEVDPKIREVLGIPPESFHIGALLGNDMENQLFHPEDVHHWTRWGAMAYFLLSLPYFSFASMENCIVIKFRIGTASSSIDAMRKAKYVLLEQRSYPFFETDTDGTPRPVYHFDRWTIYDAALADGMRPYCVTETSVNPYMNALLYVFNAYLIDLAPKYILMLHLRLTTERNKEIARILCEKIYKASGFDPEFDEYAIGNYFTKTIRAKLSELQNTWEKREVRNRVDVDGELMAMQVGKKLGILPLNDLVAELIYKNITN